MKASEFFDIPETLKIFSPFFSMEEEPWKWLSKIEKALLAYGKVKPAQRRSFIKRCLKNLLCPETAIQIGENVHIGENVKLPVSCTIEDNVFIGDNTEIRSGALIRKNVIIGENCLIGNSCEVKNSILLDYVKISHFNYVGDSILGAYAHLSAGAILSNLRFDDQPVKIKTDGGRISTDLRKFGAVLGDHTQVGCNSVLLPGTILGKNATVSVGMVFGGVLAKNQTVYAKPEHIKIDKI